MAGRIFILDLNRCRQSSYCGVHYSIADAYGDVGYLVSGCGGPYYAKQTNIKLSTVPARDREKIRRRMDELLQHHEITGEEYNSFFDRDAREE